MVDLIHRINGAPVTHEVLREAAEMEVLSVRMPVLSATELTAEKLRALDEHECDYGRLLPVVRALREQVDWPTVRRAIEGNPYAETFLVLLERLGVVAEQSH